MASIRRRGRRSWQVRVTVRDPATGEFTQKAVTVRGTKRDAERVAAELEAEKGKGMLPLNGRMTVAEYLERWLGDYAAHNVNPRTLAGYQMIVRQHLIPALGSLRLEQLHPMHVEHYYARALELGKKTRGGGGLSPTTVLQHHRVLREALSHAVRKGLLARNPADLVEPPRRNRPEMKVLTPEQVPALLRAVEGTWLYMPVFLAVHTGMRLSEILGLTWGDVDLEARKIHVRQTLFWETDGRFRFLPPKGGRGRVIKVGPDVVTALRRHRSEQAKWRLAMGPAWPPYDLVVTREDGMPISPGTVSPAFAKVVRRLGLSIRFHDLRHTHATLLLRAGVPPKVVAERLGHSTITVTMDVYSHVLPDMQEEAVARFEQVLGRASGQIVDK